MRKTLLMIAATCLAAGATLSAWSQQPAAPAPAGHYSAASTQVGTLLDDPAAAAVLKKMIPAVYANPMFQQDGRSLTLKDIQTYEPDALSDANIAKIQAEFDKLPPKG